MKSFLYFISLLPILLEVLEEDCVNLTDFAVQHILFSLHRTKKEKKRELERNS